MKTKKLQRLKLLLPANKTLKTGLILALFFLFIPILKGQTYFNRLYNNGIGTYSVLSLEEGYFLPAQIQPGNTVGIATMQTDSLGKVIGGDTTTVQGYYLFPRLAGSARLINDNIFYLGILQKTNTDFKGVLCKYNGKKNKEVNRYKYQDSISVFFSSMVVGKKGYLTTIGLAQKYTGGLNVYQSQLLLMQLDTLGNKLWERSYPAKSGLWHLQGNNIIATDAGGFAVGGGGAYGNLQKQSYAYILVTDSLGNKLNERYFMNDEFGNYVIDLQQKKNGNFLIVYSEGYKLEGMGSAASSRTVIIEELDQNTLQTLWHKEYLSGFQNTRSASRIIPQNDSTYLLRGNYWPDPILYPGTYAHQLGYIFAITSNGDSLWYRDYVNATDPQERNYLNDIAITPDGGIVGAGDLFTPKSPYTGGLASHVWLFKTDSIGCLYAGCDTVYEKAKPPVTEYKVYPNPAQAGQDLIIELPNAKSAKATLYNTIGQVVFQKEIEFVSGVSSLPLGEGWGGVNLRSGIFYLNLQTPSGKTYVEKIVLY